MTIDGPVALFKSSTNCSRAPFSAPGPYCWSGPLKARPGPEPPEAPARVQPCDSQPAGSQSGSPGAAGDPAAHSSTPRRPGHRRRRHRHRHRRRPGRDSATGKRRAPEPSRPAGSSSRSRRFSSFQISAGTKPARSGGAECGPPSAQAAGSRG
ncbi:serine/arginine repetitive matrix protein 3-like [Symphalangus syndactylus]|uniref:serine/arginine repetitive matrix protein 3-like n=1 Tax=Symphalangus syndactylus TaxID=9590 RepID=UPI0024417861|nr:serine/arginine repetitive matrix protein 3-like [Symphalangus syndactylus]